MDLDSEIYQLALIKHEHDQPNRLASIKQVQSLMIDISNTGQRFTREDRLSMLSELVGRRLSSSKEMTIAEVLAAKEVIRVYAESIHDEASVESASPPIPEFPVPDLQEEIAYAGRLTRSPNYTGRR